MEDDSRSTSWAGRENPAIHHKFPANEHSEDTAIYGIYDCAMMILLLNRKFIRQGMLEKAASGVLAILPCSRTPCTLRASNNGEPLRDLASDSRPCWMDFFEHLVLLVAVSSQAFIRPGQ